VAAALLHSAVTRDSLFPTYLAPLFRSSPLALAALLFVIALLTFTWRLGEGPIYRTMEGREALVMQEIVRSENWILPLRNGETIPSKPPLLHWLGAVIAHFTGGVSEWSARLPCALFSALSVALTCLLGCRLANREVGVLAGLLLLTTPAVVEMAREAWVDPALAFFVLAALASFSFMYENEHWRGWRSLAFYLSLAGAVLGKGPVGYILPLIVIVAYLTIQGQLSRLRCLFSWSGVLLAVGLPLIWYALAFQQEGWAFVHKQILQENVQRFTAGSGKRIPSAAFFFGPALSGGLPWSVLFCLGLWHLSRHAPVREKGVFALVWWFTVLIFFSLSAGKREVYLLPAYPAMALFAAEWGWSFAPVQARPFPTLLRVLLRLLAWGIALILLGSALGVVLGWLTIEAKWLDRLLGEYKWSNIALYIRLLSEHPMYGLPLVAIQCGLGIWAVYMGTAGRWRTALWVTLVALVIATAGLYPFTRAYAKEFKALTGFAAAIRQEVSPHDPLWFYTPEPYSSEFDEFAQVYFYLDRRVPLAPCAEQANFSHCEPGYYILRTRFRQIVESSPHTCVVLESTDSAGPGAQAKLLLVHLSKEEER
jgi:4-amino-4-deoxy-L-arabinose transferase-like glycosyltransferase